MQALSSLDNEPHLRSYDHASGLFQSAVPDQPHRVALLQSGDWEAWQINGLREFWRVVSEDEVDFFIGSTAA